MSGKMEDKKEQLKQLLNHLKYYYLGEGDKYSMIIWIWIIWVIWSSRKHKTIIRWSIEDLKWKKKKTHLFVCIDTVRRKLKI